MAHFRPIVARADTDQDGIATREENEVFLKLEERRREGNSPRGCGAGPHDSSQISYRILPPSITNSRVSDLMSKWLSVRRAACVVSCLLLAVNVVPIAAAEPFVFDHENVLGTSLEIQVDADSEAAAIAVESTVLAEIDRLARIFSSYDPHSEFSRWQSSTGVATSLSPELFELLSASDRWRTASQGAFNPAVEHFTRLWKRGQERDSIPTEAELAATSALVNRPQWSLNQRTREATRLVEGPLNLNAIAKGAIVDRACEKAIRESSDVRSVIVNIGGDLRILGATPQRVDIADPFHDAVNDRPLATILVQNRGVATSGNYRRGFTINGRRYSHVIDPRTGQPVTRLASATVVAPTTAEANALAVIFNVLPIEESRALAENLSGFEWLLVAADGRQTRSHGWEALAARSESARSTQLASADDEKQPDTTESKPEADPKSDGEALLELLVKFELSRPHGQGYRRPYVAIWLEDKDEFPVRTSVLWMQTRQPGPRWHRDLIRWYRNDRARKLADGKDLIGTISSATRGPGEYKAVFDGKDDSGKPLPAGKYTLYIEAAREHGTYQLVRHELQLGRDPIGETKLKNNAEIKSASVEYRVPEVREPTDDSDKKGDAGKK